MSSNLRRLITLKPYDNHLADGVAEIWLVFVRISIAAIALCDGIAWGYLAFVTASGPAAFVAAVMCGVIAFLMVASLDSSFVMHDVNATHDAPPEQRPAESRAGRVWQWLASHIRARHAAVVARILLVTLTFVVTAPALTLLFFARDIDAAIARANEQAESSKIAAITKRYDDAIARSRAALAQRMRDHEREVAGSGKSGRYGDGPTAKTIRRDIETIEQEFAAFTNAKKAELAAFAAATPQERARRWGLELEREGPDARNRAVTELSKTVSFRKMRSNIKWFLAFLFLSLLTLKFFQPRAVRRYYSDELQTAWANYLAGEYNGRLGANLHPGRTRMTPSQFVRWYETQQRGIEEVQTVKDHVANKLAILEVQRQALERLRGDRAEVITKMRQDLDAAQRTKIDLEKKVADAKQHLGQMQIKIRDGQRELDDFKWDATMSEGMSLRERANYMHLVSSLMSQKERCERQLDLNRNNAIALEREVATLEQQQADNETYRNRITMHMNQNGEAEAELRRAIEKVNRAILNELSRPL